MIFTRIPADLECYEMTVRGHFFASITCAIILNFALSGTVCAGFWSSDDTGKSGLDFNRGYDVNTVSTITGRVISPPHPGEKENVIVEIKVGKETLNLSVGPESHWEKKGVAIHVNDELTVKGSRAQGQDGKSYLLAQKLVNRTTGTQVDLRNEKGEPAWSGVHMDRSRPDSAADSMRNQGGAMMRSGGGGMMRSGGGGMMRH
jgi:hypothetical protein